LGDPAVPDDKATAKYIEELEDENEWLEQTVEALRRRLSDAPVEDEGRESIGALYVAELRTKNEQLEATVGDLESKLTETTKALEAAQAEAKATDAASSNHDATNEQVAELEEARDHLERRLRKDRQTLKNAQETVEQLRSEKQDLEAKAQQLRQAEAENEELKAQIEGLHAKLESLKADRAAASADAEPSEPDDENADAAYAEIQQKLGDAFQSWCQQGRVMVGRYYMFERAVQDTYPDATVSPIYYTPEAAIPFQFEDRRAVATFWLVEIRGTSFLLPVPRRDGTFEALEPAVPARSDATPAELAHAIPARMVASDSGYEIDEAGQLNFETSSLS
jgi:phage shock protein A